MNYDPERQWKVCEKCKQKVPPMNLFLCKGKMVCEGCFKEATENNTKFIDESQYPRRIRD